MISKRGQAFLAKKVINFIIGIACLLLLLFAGKAVFGLVFGEQKNLIAQGSVDDLAVALEGLEAGQQEDYLLLTPKNWFLVSFSEDDARKPNECLGACICICPGKTFGGYDCDKGFCKTLSKEIKFDRESYKIPMALFLKSTERFFEISLKEELKLEVKKIETSPGIEVITTYSLPSHARPANAVIDTIVLHHTGGSTFESAYDTLKTKGFSAHYAVEKNGRIYYMVDEKEMAYHAGDSDYNARSIGIEIVNTGEKDDKYTEAQYTAINSLIDAITKRWPAVKLGNEHIIGHFEIQFKKTGKCETKWDPSPNFDWSKIGLPNHVTSDKECPLLVKNYGYTAAV